MSRRRNSGGETPPREPGLGRVVLEDLRRTRLQSEFLREIKDLFYFYVDQDTRAKLAGMGRVRSAFWLLGWLFKSLYMKLSPGRRIGLVLAVLLGIMGWTDFAVGARHYTFNFGLWGFLLLLVVLMLELKDKLLAKDEIQIARQVQIALLPSEQPVIPGWSVWGYSRPANDVGGDLVDYIELDGFRHGVALGDVAGKGLGAALLSAKLQATLRALVPEAASLDDLGARVNTIFHRDGLDNRFATLFYAELEYHSGQLRYINAGHNPPFVIRPDRIESLPASSFPLGMLPSARYEECALQIDPGTVILVYSDGLTEAVNESGEEFGLKRIEDRLQGLRALPPAEIGTTIIEAVDRFVGGARVHDDLSVVVIVKQ